MFDNEIHKMLTANTNGTIGTLKEGWRCGNKNILRGMLAMLEGLIDYNVNNDAKFKDHIGSALYYVVIDRACKDLKARNAIDNSDASFEFVFRTWSGRRIGAVQSELDPETRAFVDLDTNELVHDTGITVASWISEITC